MEGWREELAQRAKLFKQVFGTDAGKKVLEQLRRDFLQGEIRAGTTQDTYYNLGQHDLVKYIIEISEVTTNE